MVWYGGRGVQYAFCALLVVGPSHPKCAQNSTLTHHDYVHLARTVHPDNERRLYVA
jgi:hypothetical protein